MQLMVNRFMKYLHACSLLNNNFFIDYDQAIQRMCVQRGPDDNQDRCANTIYNYKKVYMCFCQGDLCNGSLTINKLQFKQIITMGAILTILYKLF